MRHPGTIILNKSTYLVKPRLNENALRIGNSYYQLPTHIAEENKQNCKFKVLFVR